MWNIIINCIYLYLHSLIMPERKIWTQEEDKILRFFREERQEKKWSLIARKMEEEFGIVGRTGKQCRQRYHNHLDSSIVTTEWTEQEEQTLYVQHDEVGNKWSIIAQRLPGRSDNCVKNHFYSKLRKAIRKLNKYISQQPRSELHQVKISLLYKIIETTQERFRNNSRVDEQLIERCVLLKNRLFKCEELASSDAVLKQLIEEINAVENKLRRRSHKESTQTVSSRSNSQNLKQKQQSFSDEEEEPVFQIFKRVCNEIMQNPI